MRSNTKLIWGLINRVTSWLPINSGNGLDSLEHDPIGKQTVAAIIELSRYKLSTTVNTLCTVLENVSKTDQSPSTSLEQHTPIEVLQSQLIILRLLSACMQHHWKSYDEQVKQQQKEQTLDASDAEDSGVVNSEISNGERSTRSTSNFQDTSPPPLDEALVTFILALTGRFLNQVQLVDDASEAASGSSEYAAEPVSNMIVIDSQRKELIMDINKVIGRILHYVSASNWTTYYTKVKNAIIALGSTNEGPEVCPPEIRMLGFSYLNRQRLHTVLSELSPYFLHMKRKGKLLFSKMMRQAIWEWIQSHPDEFGEVCASESRLLSGSENLFDMCNSAADNLKKKVVLWPLQTILLILSQGLLLQDYLVEPSPQNRRINFLDTLKKSLKVPKSADVAAICYVDLCKAATFVPPADDSALRHIAADIENDLEELLWDFSRPSITEATSASLGYNIDYQTLVTEYLLARIRLNPENAVTTLIPPCLEENVPTTFKLAFVKACLAIAQEDKGLPWNPSISYMYTMICGPLRQLFLQILQAESGPQTKVVGSIPSPRRSIPITENRNLRKGPGGSTQTELIQSLLKLFSLDTHLALLDDRPDAIEHTIAIMTGMTNLLQHSDQGIRQSAADCLTKLHQSSDIPRWGPSDTMMTNFWRISSQVVFILAKEIIEIKYNEDQLSALLTLLAKLLIGRNDFLRHHQSIASDGSDGRERLQASVALEIALLVSLCWPKPEICSDAVRCLGYLCDEAHLLAEDEDAQHNHVTFISNLRVYADLATEDTIFLGRKAQQRRIRKYMRMIMHHTPGNLAAWEEVWTRWKILTQLMNRVGDDSVLDEISQDKKLKTRNVTPGVTATMTNNKQTTSRVDVDDDKHIMWQNYTGFLAALGGCCIASDALPNGKLGEQGPQKTSAPGDPQAMTDIFIGEMINLLVSENVFIREGVMDTLGSDLSPALYSILFRQIETSMARCFDGNGEPVFGMRNTLFVEQAIMVLKLILSRLVSPNDILLNINFNTLIYQFARYLNKLPNGVATLGIKIKMCHLLDVLMQKRERIIIRDEMRLRNKLLEITVEWTSDFALQKAEPRTYMMHDALQMEKMQRDLDHACLTAIVSLLRQLPLQPSEPSHAGEDSQSKSHIFYKYFTFFLKLLNRCRLNEVEANSNTVLRANMEANGVPSKSIDNSQYWTTIKEETILALSNLLSANVDAGLKYSLDMGYHEDMKTRAVFMQVLTNILKQGTEFETLSETVMTNRYEKLIDMLVETDLEIALSLCEVCPSTSAAGVAETLLICFDSRDRVMPFLKAVIEKEVTSTEQEPTLFRGTTMATRLLSVFAKLICPDYIRVTLQPAMEAINSLPPEQLTWELDPQKLGPNDNLAKNKENVIRATEILLNAICSSVENAPRAFREELSYIAETVSKYFPESKYTAVGGFVFLRLFGPAIVSPEDADFSKQAVPQNRNVRKLQLQAARVIQNLSNNTMFGAKETHMIILNDFLTNNLYKVTSFLRELATVPAEGGNTTVSNLRIDHKVHVRLHRYLFDNLERMSRDLATRKIKGVADTQSLLEWKKTLDRLSNLVAQLGRPSEISQNELTYSRNYAFTNSNHYYSEFMRRNYHRDISAVSSFSIFFQGGVSRSGRPVFYIVAKKLEGEQRDFELLVYYMLRVMEPHLNRPFEILFDLTHFGESSEIPVHWLAQFFQLIISEINDNLATLYLYNPNSYLQRYIKRLPRSMVNRLMKRAVFCVALSELYERIAPSEVRLPKSTVNLEKDPSIAFYPVSRIISAKSSIPVTVKISQEYIQIITVRKQELSYSMSTVLNDVYHISELEDIAALPSSRDDGSDLLLKYDQGKSSMVLSTPSRDAMLTRLLYNKKQYETSKPGGMNERALRPSDVPGRLLNMALLNIGSDDYGLRLAAYNLLYSLSVAFRFDVGNQLLNTQDLCIPANSTDFIVGISESIASTEQNLTIEFLNECLIGFKKSNESMRQLCLDYMVPWLRNLASFGRDSPDEHAKNMTRTKDIIRLLIELTVLRTDIYKHVQARVWRTLAKVENLISVILDSFVQYSVEHGFGSTQAEVIADTIVTMSSVSVRGKVISRLRKAIQKTSLRPCRSLTEHQAWTEIVILLRFALMLSFNNTGPVKLFLPEIFHVVSLLVGIGPTFVRSSVHELVVNSIHMLCTGMPLSDESVKRLHYILVEVCDSRTRVYFGLTKPNANALTITQDTLKDFAEDTSLYSLQSIIDLLLDVISIGAPSTDTANIWRARWMGLVTSTAFRFNPAIQPRAFVVLGCLAQNEVDDNLIYQILVSLRSSLLTFDETEPNLIVSIMMCLGNVIDNMPISSRYLLPHFWLAVALVQMNHPATFNPAVNYLQAVLRALDTHTLFDKRPVAQVLLEARQPIADITKELDEVTGVNFETHFSFAIAGILFRGLKHGDPNGSIFHCLTTFLEIECKRSADRSLVDARTLGYLAGLLPFAAKSSALRELLRLAGIHESDLERIPFGTPHAKIFDILEIPDNTTALLLVSLLVTLLNAAENESERLFLYSFLAEAAVSIPEVFALVYESLLPKMNQIVANGQNFAVIDAVKNILITACSEPAFSYSANRRSQKAYLDDLKFPALGDPAFGDSKANTTRCAQLAAKLLERLTE